MEDFDLIKKIINLINIDEISILAAKIKMALGVYDIYTFGVVSAIAKHKDLIDNIKNKKLCIKTRDL